MAKPAVGQERSGFHPERHAVRRSVAEGFVRALVTMSLTASCCTVVIELTGSIAGCAADANGSLNSNPDDGGLDAGGSMGAGAGCDAITYPSGIRLVSHEDPALESTYRELGTPDCSVPRCFLDALDLHDPDGTRYDVNVRLGAHFTLYELIRTEVDPKSTGAVDSSNAYSTSVLINPALVTDLERLRTYYGGPVTLSSGYRSPTHQRALCESICRESQCVDSMGAITCAKDSRHMWGAAADMGLQYESAATEAGLPVVFRENGGTGRHLHVDLGSCD